MSDLEITQVAGLKGAPLSVYIVLALVRDKSFSVGALEFLSGYKPTAVRLALAALMERGWAEPRGTGNVWQITASAPTMARGEVVYVD